MPKTEFERVWYVPGEGGALPKNIRARRDIGTLVVSNDGLEFRGRKTDLSITGARRVSLDTQRGILGVDWVRIEYGEGEPAFFADSAWFGWHAIFGGTKNISIATAAVKTLKQPTCHPPAPAITDAPANTGGEIKQNLLEPLNGKPCDETGIYRQWGTSDFERERVEGQVKSSANVFFLIAGLSLLNSIVLMLGVSWYFLIGLGMTQLVDGVSMGLAENVPSGGAAIVRTIGFAVDVGISALFVMFGVYGRRIRKWPFVAGMVLYGLDGLLLLFVEDFWSFGFHLFFLYLMYNGLKAYDRSRQVGFV